MKAALLILAPLISTSALAQGLTCKEKVEIMVKEENPAGAAADVSAELSTDKYAVDPDAKDNTQLWKVKLDFGVDGGGVDYTYVVTYGEGIAACTLGPAFNF